MQQVEFETQIAKLLNEHNPSKHPFFQHLENAKRAQVHSEQFLDELYKRYQAAMHATRVMIFFLPHLDTVDLRALKLKFLKDDDDLPHSDSHHSQLRRTWTFMLGREPIMKDCEFGSLASLEPSLDTNTRNFVEMVRERYPKSLGAWVVVEGLAHNWIGSLLRGLTPHFPKVEETDYFKHNYTSQLELKHASLALSATARVLSNNPSHIHATILDAKLCAATLDKLWTGFDNLLLSM